MNRLALYRARNEGKKGKAKERKRKERKLRDKDKSANYKRK